MVSGAEGMDGGTDQALARSVLCRALQLGLALPSTSSLAALFGPRERDAILGAAALLGAGPETDLAAAVEALVDGPAPALEEIRKTHDLLFGHTLRGRVCPYETEYGAGVLFQQAQELADISGYYLAFGLRLPDGLPERPDHAACEIEFYQFLALKETYAMEGGEVEMLELTRKAGALFLRDHLGRFGRAFGARLAGEDAGGFYGRLGAALSAFLAGECRRLGVSAGPELMELRSTEDDAVPMACGAEPSESRDDLVQIGARLGG